MAIAPETPVIIGVGFCQQKKDDALACDEPLELMRLAVLDAARDAGQQETLLTQLDSISVEQGMWQYRNPGKWIADAVGSPQAKSVLADLGVLQMTPLFNLFDAIVRGEQQLGIVTGGEAKYRELRAKIAGVTVHHTVQGEETPAPDLYHPTPDPFATAVESAAGIMMPVELFAVIESAIRYQRGLTPDAHRDDLAALYHQFSEIASRNPHAWNQDVVPASDIRNPVGKNAMLAFPYTKKHNSQWNVNQAVAILVASYGKATALGLDASRFIYPVAAAQSRHVVCLAQQQQLHSHPGTVMAGQTVYQLAGIAPQDIVAADLYSCFPSSVQSFAHDLQLNEQCPWSVTGSMAFAGGPYNHGALDGVARMAEVLREAGQGSQATQYGLTSNLSGIFGKQAVALFANAPHPQGYRFADITEAVAAVDKPLPVTGDYVGPARIVGYTVVFNQDTPSHGFAYCDTEDGSRTVVRCTDGLLLQQMMQEEFVGRRVMIHADRHFSL